MASMELDEQSLAEIAERFEQDGFVKIEPIFGEERMAEIERELAGYMQEIAPGVPSDDIVYEAQTAPDGSRAIRNLWRMERHSGFFAKLAQDPVLLSLARRLVHGDPVSCGVELFAKPARVGSVVPFHQDNAYFNLTPPDGITCWIALDDSTPENGCIYYARGSHQLGLRAHKASGVKGNSLAVGEAPGPEEFEQVPGMLRRGGAIIHHCVLLHRSEPNVSGRSRRGLLLVYKGAHCQTDAEGARAYRAVLAGMK